MYDMERSIPIGFVFVENNLTHDPSVPAANRTRRRTENGGRRFGAGAGTGRRSWLGVLEGAMGSSIYRQARRGLRLEGASHGTGRLGWV